MKPMNKICMRMLAACAIAASLNATALASAEDGNEANNQGNQATQNAQGVPSFAKSLSGLFKSLETGTIKTGEVAGKIAGSGFGLLATLTNKASTLTKDEWHKVDVSALDPSSGELSPGVRTIREGGTDVEVTAKSTQELLYGMQLVLKTAHGMDVSILSVDAAKLDKDASKPAKLTAKFDSANKQQTIEMVQKIAASKGMDIKVDAENGRVFVARKTVINAMAKSGSLSDDGLDDFLSKQRTSVASVNDKNFSPSNKLDSKQLTSDIQKAFKR